MIDTQVVQSHPEIMSGAPVFVGTRVPVQALLDTLEEGDNIDSFLEGYPAVSRDQVVAFLEQAADALFRHLPRAA